MTSQELYSDFVESEKLIMNELGNSNTKVNILRCGLLYRYITLNLLENSKKFQCGKFIHEKIG